MQRFWRRLALLQISRPWLFLLPFLGVALAGGWRASRLRLVTDLSDLLSPEQPSVVELRRVLGRSRGLANLFVVLEGSELQTLRDFADRLCPRLRAIGSPYVESARSGFQEARRFMVPRLGLFLTAAELDDLEARVVREERRAIERSLLADLDEQPGEKLSSKELEETLNAKLGPYARYPDGYYQGQIEGGWAVIVIVKAAVPVGDLPLARQVVARVEQVVNAALAERGLPAAAPALAQVRWGAGRPLPPLRVGYAGDVVTGVAEYSIVRDDVLEVGAGGLALILGVLLLFFRSPRVLIALGVTVAIGSAATFGATELALDHLNVATAFLFSIVAGNGVNCGIIWMARFLEARRGGDALARAVERAHAETCGATLAAAGAAAAAYAALGVGHFRAFRHFAFIGAIGMMLCWVITYLVLPAIVNVLDRWRPLVRPGAAAAHSGGSPAGSRFELPFVWLVSRAPGAVLVGSALVTLAALGAAALYLRHGPIEHDMRNLRGDAGTTGELYRVSNLAGRTLNSATRSGMLVLADDARDTPVLARILREVRDRAPAGTRPFEEVRTLDDFVPPDQESRLPRLQALTRRLTRANDRGAFDEAGWERIARLLPPPDLRPFTVADLPQQLTEAFTEKDGTIGRILYLEPTRGQSENDLRYLIRWADAFRRTRLPDGREVLGSGPAVIYADLLRSMLVDGPRALAVSLGLTAAAVILLFRRVRPVAAVLGSLLLGLIWMAGALGAADVKVSFINFIALPVTFGIGIDYAVNVYGRYQQDRAAGILAALRGAGGPVILCSMTTTVGYLALLRAHNAGVRSLGAVAVLGEVGCLLTAVLVLPAALAWRERRRS